jgi:hypothetical protein
VRPVDLRPWEAHRLALAGDCLLIRPLLPAPYPVSGKKESHVQWCHPLGGFDAARWPAPLGPAGTWTWAREWHWRRGVWSRLWRPDGEQEPAQFYPSWPREGEPASDYVRYEGPASRPRGPNWRRHAPQSMPRWATRFPAVRVARVRFRRLADLGSDEAHDAGLAGPSWALPEAPAGTRAAGLIAHAWDRRDARKAGRASGNPWAALTSIKVEEPADGT